MGKKAKEHRKKVQARNARIKSEQNAYNKKMNQMMEQMMSNMKNNMTDISETTNEENNGVQPIQPNTNL